VIPATFADRLAELERLDLDAEFARVTAAEVDRVLSAAERGEKPDERGLIALLAPAAAPHLERMARLAHAITLSQYGRTILLYTPLYLANHCENGCRYCGFSASAKAARRRLTVGEAVEEARAVAAESFRHVLLLTGEAKKSAGVEYVAECVRAIAPLMDAVSIEIFACETEEYARLVEAGADGLTIYQETYDRARYEFLHPFGPKRDFDFRLASPERGAKAGMREVGVGALLGLADWRRDAFTTIQHAAWLMRAFPSLEVGMSMPRMRPHHAEKTDPGCFTVERPVTDAEFAQIMTAARIALPRCGITLSTRESATFRENMLPLGVTRMSAGSCTAVGARSSAGSGEDATPGQFEVADERSAAELARALAAKGWQATATDWKGLAQATREASRPVASGNKAA
jgi:2-iminoacetate synthase